MGAWNNPRCPKNQCTVFDNGKSFLPSFDVGESISGKKPPIELPTTNKISLVMFCSKTKAAVRVPHPQAKRKCVFPVKLLPPKAFGIVCQTGWLYSKKHHIGAFYLI